MILEVIKHALMITGFVFVMMLVIEYINVQTRGVWNEKLKGKRWSQYLLAAILGATPGCLGAFTVVALYSHGIVSFGALVTAMIATSGDEAFVMFVKFPQKALLLTGIIFVVGILVGIVTDKIFTLRFLEEKIRSHKFSIHEEERCTCFTYRYILQELKKPSAERIVLSVFLIALLVTILTGFIGPQKWNWIRVTLLVTSLVSLFIVVTVPEHFLKEHLWDHIVKVHIPRIFLWTFGALLVIEFLFPDLKTNNSWMEDKLFIILIIACLVGLIPESGPHLIFVISFAEGKIPFSILLASSIVQDGHGMLPMLAESKRGFLIVKTLNFAVGFLIGIVGILTGF